MNMLMNPNQTKKLLQLFSYLREKNDYFSDFIPYEIKTEEELLNSFSNIPIHYKSDIKTNFLSYISKSQVNILEEVTSGTTGEPLRCLKSNIERMQASLYLWKKRKKIDPYVTANNFFSFYGKASYYELGDFCDFDKENMIHCFKGMQKLKPRWINGPISAIERYAKLIELGEVKYSPGDIKFIEFSGEYVDPQIKEYIEYTFGCKTYNQYGLRETWCIAYECFHGQLHIAEDLIYAESIASEANIKINNKNVEEIVVTSLYNQTMPIIRYNTQDLGIITQSNCQCGEEGKILHLAGGRSGDVIVGKKEILGDIFFKRVVGFLMRRGYDCIESFSVVQTDLNKFDIYIIKKANYTDHYTTELNELICTGQWRGKSIFKGLGSNIVVNYLFVESLPKTFSGKTKIFTSNLKPAGNYYSHFS